MDMTGMTYYNTEYFFFDDTNEESFGYYLKVVMSDIYDYFECKSATVNSTKNCTDEELAMRQWGDSRATNTIAQDYSGYPDLFPLSYSILYTFKNTYAFANPPELRYHSK
jgi:hypothetical protein